MRKIKSLVYRELVISKKFYITNIAVVVVFMVMCWLTQLSIEYGNIAKLFEFETDDIDRKTVSMLKTVIYYAFVCFVSFASANMINDNGTALSDIKSRWRILSFTLPVKPYERALSRYIVKVMTILTALLMSIVNWLVLSAMTGSKLKFSTVKIFMLFICVCTFNDLLQSIILTWAKNEKEALLSNCSFVATMAIVLAWAVKLTKKLTEMAGELFSEQENEIVDSDILLENIRLFMQYIADEVDKTADFAFPALIVIIIAGFFINISLLKRRDK